MKKIAKICLPVVAGLTTLGVVTPLITSCKKNNDNNEPLIISGGTANLSGKYKISDKDSNPLNVKYKGTDVTSETTLTIVKAVEDQEAVPFWIQIDPNTHAIMWTQDAEIGTYKFKVQGEYTPEDGQKMTVVSNVFTLVIDSVLYVGYNGGSYDLSGTYGNQGSSAGSINVSFNHDPVTDVSLSITETNVDWITINKSNNKIEWIPSAAGPFSFNVHAIYMLDGKKYEGDSDKFTLTVGNKLTIGGGTSTLNGIYHEEGNDSVPLNVFKNDVKIDTGFNLEIINLADEYKNWITVNTNNQIAWTEEIGRGEYTFKVKATYDGLEAISETFTLIVADKLSISGGSKLITAQYNDTGTDDGHPLLVDYSGADVTQDVELKVEAIGEPIDWIHVSNDTEDKIICWEEAKLGTYKFKVTAEYEGLTAETEEFTIVVGDKLFINYSGSYLINCKHGDIGNETNRFEVNCSGQTVTEGVEYSVIGVEPSPAPNWIKINSSQQISWNKAVAGTYRFQVKATYKDLEAISLGTFTLTVNDRLSIDGGTPELHGEHHIAGNDNKPINVFKNDEQVTEGFNLVVTNSTADNDLIYINTNNQIAWKDGIKSGEYTFKVKATYDDLEAISETFTLKIADKLFVVCDTYELTATRYKDGKSENSIVVNFSDDDVTNAAELSIVPLSSNDDFPIEIEKTTHLIKWSSDIVNDEYKFKIHAKYELNGKLFEADSRDFILHVVDKLSIVGGTSKLNGRYHEAGIDEVPLSVVFNVTPVTSAVVNSLKIVPVTPESEDFPDWIGIDKSTTGEPKIYWSNDAEKGTYIFKVSAEYTPEGGQKIEAESEDEFTLTIGNKLVITSSETQFSGKAGYDGHGDNLINVKYNEKDISPSYSNFEIVDEDLRVISGMRINETYQIAWLSSMTTPDVYKFRIKLTYVDGEESTTAYSDVFQLTLTKNIRVGYNGDPATSLRGSRLRPGHSEGNLYVMLNGSISIISDSDVKFVGQIQEEWISEQKFELNKATGEFKWKAGLPVGRYEFKVLASYEGLDSELGGFVLTIDE